MKDWIRLYFSLPPHIHSFFSLSLSEIFIHFEIIRNCNFSLFSHSVRVEEFHFSRFFFLSLFECVTTSTTNMGEHGRIQIQMYYSEWRTECEYLYMSYFIAVDFVWMPANPNCRVENIVILYILYKIVDVKSTCDCWTRGANARTRERIFIPFFSGFISFYVRVCVCLKKKKTKKKKTTTTTTTKKVVRNEELLLKSNAHMYIKKKSFSITILYMWLINK